MKIVVVGGTGLIGSKLVARLTDDGHEAVAAAPHTSVNTLNGQGLSEALDLASVVVDVSNPTSLENQAVLDFFTTSTGNLLVAEMAAGVGHHVALSVVGTQRLLESGYFRGKMAQQDLIEVSSMRYSIVHATQFYEFVKNLAMAATGGDTVRLAPVLIRPMAADDVAAAVGRVTVGDPLNSTIEVAGPEEFRLDQLVRHVLGAHQDPRHVVADGTAPYFGAQLEERTLLPGDQARLSSIRFDEWMTHAAVPA